MGDTPQKNFPVKRSLQNTNGSAGEEKKNYQEQIPWDEGGWLCKFQRERPMIWLNQHTTKSYVEDQTMGGLWTDNSNPFQGDEIGMHNNHCSP